MPFRYPKFGQRLRRLRGNRSLAEVAGAVMITAPALQRYEKGRLPRGEILTRLASFYKTSVAALLEDDPGKIAEAREDYLSPREQRLMNEIDRLLESGDEMVFSHLKRQVDLLHDAVAHRKEKGKG